MKRSILRWASALMIASGLALQVRADNITNNFDVGRNYVANGIVGETNWDGVYLNFGDIPKGDPGGSGNGATLQGDTTFASGYLTVSTIGSDWSGTGDDGFYAWKLVSGDFDVSVESVPIWQNQANNFGGLLVRAWNTNQSGAPISFTSATSSENWVALFRAQQFGIGEIRHATNGANFENTFPENANDTNTTRFYRITRTADLFTFYVKTNAGDGWTLITNAGTGGGYVRASGSINRPDWNGQPVQVGIAQAIFARPAAPAQDFFTDFELSGPNVSLGTPTLPGTPSAIVSTDTNTGGSLTFSWTVGTPGDSSLVIVKRNGGILVNPIQGLTYNADPAFGSSNALMGAGQSVVYNGTGNSVTVTNLGANNINYTVAVYEYTNTGSAIIYNTASPTTNAFVGPGVITAANLKVPQNDIPVAGAVRINLIASFSTGETSDQSGATGWVSSDPTVATIDVAGAVTGITNGVTTITGTFGPFVLTTNITVHTPVFVDGFTSTNDFITNGIIGSGYNGMFLNFGDFPGQFADATGPGQTFALNSQITSTNGLTMNSAQTDWQGIRDDGTFLFKTVPGSQNGISGDFEASTEIVTMNTLNAVKVGIMARLYNPTTGGPAPGGNENHVNYYKVQNGSTQISSADAATATIYVATGPSAANRFMLLQRVNSTNFYFFERATTNAPWTFVTNIVLFAATNNAPMEVGIAEETRSGVTALATVRSFMLDAAGVVSVTTPPPANNFGMTLNGNLSMTLNWVAADGLGNPVQSIAVMRAGSPVSVQPSLGQPLTASSVFGAPASGLGSGNYVVFVSDASPASTNNTVTVSGLIPGVTYYAAIFSFTGAGATEVFSQTGPTNALTDGFLIGVQGSLAGGIPRGGVAQLLVQAIYTGGFPVDVSTLANVSSADTNIIKVLNGFLSGMTNGVVRITNSFGGFTNVALVTVRDPFFTDNFTNNHDYLVDGVAGTGWDELYNPTAATNPVPGSVYVPLANSGTTVALATNISNDGITVTNGLTISAAGDGWEGGNAGGFFLFKYVPGDFQMAIHIISFNVAGFNQPGLMARAYASSNGVFGYPLGYAITNAGGTNDAGEYWVDLTRFDEFSIGTYARNTIDGTGTGTAGTSQNGQPDLGDANFWLLITRTQGTNFNFFKRLNPTDPWKRTPNNVLYRLPQFAGRPMQVGIAAGPWTGATGNQNTVNYENFMLDITSGSLLKVTPSGANVIVSWPPIPGTLQHSTSLSSPNWQPVSGTPTLDSNGYSLTVPELSGTEFFRLKQ